MQFSSAGLTARLAYACKTTSRSSDISDFSTSISLFPSWVSESSLLGSGALKLRDPQDSPSRVQASNGGLSTAVRLSVKILGIFPTEAMVDRAAMKRKSLLLILDPILQANISRSIVRIRHCSIC